MLSLFINFQLFYPTELGLYLWLYHSNTLWETCEKSPWTHSYWSCRFVCVHSFHPTSLSCSRGTIICPLTASPPRHAFFKYLWNNFLSFFKPFSAIKPTKSQACLNQPLSDRPQNVDAFPTSLRACFSCTHFFSLDSTWKAFGAFLLCVCTVLSAVASWCLSRVTCSCCYPS